MLVTNNESINRYVADGIVKLFPIVFQFLNNDHVAVYRYESGTLVKVDKSEYTISGAGSELGGQCEFTLAPASGIVLAFIRDVPITQLTQYSELDNFPAESHENALSKLTMICQMLAESLTRAVTVSPTSTETPGELVERIFDARDRAETAATATAVSEEAAASSAMASAASAANSDASANLAEQWASSPYGSVVENGEYSAKHYSIEAKNAVPDNLVGRVEVVEGKTQPATTTSRGIGRVATRADMEPGAIIENGPAFLDAATVKITATPTANAVPQADGSGKINKNWLSLDPPFNPQPSLSGTATFVAATNTITMTGIVTALGLDVGDVIQFGGSADTNNKKLRTVEAITNNNTIVVNYEHCGNRGNGSLKLSDQSDVSVTCTRIAKWYNAPDSLGRAWVVLSSSLRDKDTTYTNSSGRPFLLARESASNSGVQVIVDGVRLLTCTYSMSAPNSVTIIIPNGSTYKTTGVLNTWSELR